jgi:glycosyltransferase involved in cell wall biosynthesis
MAAHKLLIVSYFFPPTAAAGSFRMLGFARHLPPLGWQTVVVAPPRLPFEPVDPELGEQVPPETVVYPVPNPQGFAWKVARKAFGPHSVWMSRALGACTRAVRDHRPDAMLTTGPPNLLHVLGLILKRRYGLPWVADFRDPWITKDAGTPTCGHMGGERSLKRRWLTRLERAVIEQADAIASTGPLATRKLCASFPEHRAKMVTLTNGYDPERFEHGESPAAAGDTVRILHAGELYAGRDPGAFLDAVRDVVAGAGGESDRGSVPVPVPVQVQFLGQNPGGFAFPEEIRRRGLETVVATPGQVPYAQALREMSGSDILLLLDSPGRRVGVPAKIYEYLGAGRSILALGEPDGDLAWVLRESGVPYRIAPLKDAPAIRQALVELIGELQGGRAAAAGAGRHQVFTRAAIAGRLVSILESLTAAAPAETETAAAATLGPAPPSEPVQVR